MSEDAPQFPPPEGEQAQPVQIPVTERTENPYPDRVEGVEKARAMAEAGDEYRTEAAKGREDDMHYFRPPFRHDRPFASSSYVDEASKEISQRYDQRAEEVETKQAEVYDELHQPGSDDPIQNPKLAETMATAEAPYQQLIKNMIETSNLEDKDEIIRLLTEEKDQLVEEAKATHLIEKAREREAKMAEHQRYVMARRKTLGILLGAAEKEESGGLPDGTGTRLLESAYQISNLEHHGLDEFGEPLPELEPSHSTDTEPGWQDGKRSVMSELWEPQERKTLSGAELPPEYKNSAITREHVLQIREAIYRSLGVESPKAEDFDFSVPHELDGANREVSGAWQWMKRRNWASIKETPTSVSGLSIREYRYRPTHEPFEITDGKFIYPNQYSDQDVERIEVWLVRNPEETLEQSEARRQEWLKKAYERELAEPRYPRSSVA